MKETPSRPPPARPPARALRPRRSCHSRDLHDTLLLLPALLLTPRPHYGCRYRVVSGYGYDINIYAFWFPSSSSSPETPSSRWLALYHRKLYAQFSATYDRTIEQSTISGIPDEIRQKDVLHSRPLSLSAFDVVKECLTRLKESLAIPAAEGARAPTSQKRASRLRDGTLRSPISPSAGSELLMTIITNAETTSGAEGLICPRRDVALCMTQLKSKTHQSIRPSSED
ncbi:hypothetical protein EVAR_19725_1 [Eumeta japonica]|uniref:Uncharacterized protein n=1 Tax=Eumeta variegata TaxID=151549 RepID=A0A4C1USA1_EUMVA|nr:hypothetical protein EVAR_19725_1 [Eumeta japonica]